MGDVYAFVLCRIMQNLKIRRGNMTCKDCMHCEICLNKRKHHIVINGFLFYFECEDIEKNMLYIQR